MVKSDDSNARIDTEKKIRELFVCIIRSDHIVSRWSPTRYYPARLVQQTGGFSLFLNATSRLHDCQLTNIGIAKGG
jgi:hypothetical protein